MIDVDGSDLVQITSEGVEPSWSPDGTKILHVRGWNLWTVSPDGSNETRLITFDTCPASHPNWSPDGTKIALVRGACGIWTVNSDGTGLDKIGDSGGGGVAWSPDGTKLLTSNTGQSNDIFSLIADGSICDEDPEQPWRDCQYKGTNVTNHPSSDEYPDW